MKKFNLLLGLLIMVFFAQDLMANPIGRRVNVNTLTALEKSTLATAMLGYIDQAVIEEHSCNSEFGNANGVSGSIHGPEMFLNWHRQYIKEMEEAIQPTLAGMGLSLLPRWNPANGIGIISPDFIAVDGDCNASCGGGNCNTPSGFPNGWGTAFPSNLTPPLTCTTWADYEAFSEAVRTGYHVVGHAASGGVMGFFRSPAAPMFWLWHAMIDDVFWDFQQGCLATSDIHIKDTPADTGAEPNPDTGPMWISSDIWVRENQDVATGITAIPHGSDSYTNEGVHQNPEYKMSGDNFIYVRIRNTGTQTFSGGRLRVYWSKASTGLSWPTTWKNYTLLGVLNGDEILPTGTGLVPDDANFYIPPIDAGDQFIMEIPWHVPNPADFSVDIHHFCILARIVSDFDEMTFPEGSGIGANVRNNNNIAWKNVSIYDLDPFNFVDPGGNAAYVAKNVDFMGVYVTNPFRNLTATTLTYNALENRNIRRNFFDIGGTAFVRMDKDIAERWAETDYAGEGLKPIGWYDDKFYVHIFSPEATMLKIPLDGLANHAIEMGYGLTKQASPDQQFEHDVVQSYEGGVIGGERYLIDLTERAQGRTSNQEALVLANNFTNLTVQPNPATDVFTLSYELAEDMQVGLSLFDITGRKVREIAGEKQSAGTYNSNVNISDLSAGVYVLRMQAGGQVISQKVVIE